MLSGVLSAGLPRFPYLVMLGDNMLFTNILRSAHARPQVVDAGGDLPVGDRGEPGPHDLEHHAASTISAALHAGTADLQWLADAYQLVFAAVMLPAGVDRGTASAAKRLLLAGLAVFLAASLWCALSVSVGELIAARALMGLGAGIVFPLSLAVVSAAFGDDDDRPKAIGILAAAVALGLPLGPVLGGVLLQHFSWHSVFWINVPAVCATLAAGAVLMPESRNPAAPPLDAPGASCPPGRSPAWSGASSTARNTAGRRRPPGRCWPGRRCCWPTSWPANAARRTPVIDPALFRDRRFTWGTVATVAVTVALFGILFVVPQYLQSVASATTRSAPTRGCCR